MTEILRPKFQKREYLFLKRMGALFLLIAVFFSLEIVVVSFAQSKQQYNAYVIDAAGRNRMLSQRIAFLSTLVAGGDYSYQSELQALIELHNTSIQAILNGGKIKGVTGETDVRKAPESVRPIIDETMQLWLEYQESAKKIAYSELFLTTESALEIEDHYTKILETAAEMLAANDKVVKAFVQADLAAKRNLRIFEIGWVFLSLFIIFISFLLARRFANAFRQNINHNNKTIEELKKNKQELEIQLQEEQLKFKEAQKDRTELGSEATIMENQRRAMLNLLEDIESEKEESENLRSRMEIAKKAAQFGVWEWDVPSNELIWDDEMYTLYGVTREDFTGAYEAWQAGLHPEDKAAGDQAIQDALEDKKPFDITFRIIRKNDGATRYIKANARVIRDDKGNPLKMVGTNYDITNEMEIDKAKTEFVSLASHQLRTPLSAINWFTEMLLNEDAGPINDQQRQYLNEVAFGSQRMVDLVNALLNVSRLELGTFAVEPEPTDLAQMLESVIEEMKPTTKKKKQRVTKKIDPSIKEVSVDPKLTRIIFQNLISNAAKYTPEKGKIGIELAVIEKGKTKDGKKMAQDTILFLVKDDGLGIPAGQQEKIFTKLFRADNVRSSDTEGTGLGLYIIKSIVDHVGGAIWFKSKEGQGTTFYVTIPKAGMKVKKGTKQLASSE